MAVEVVQQRWCDWHLRVGEPGERDTEPGERVEAVEFQVAFTPSAHSAEPLTVDLCEDCMRYFGDRLMELVASLATKKQEKRTRTAKPLRADGKPKASQIVHACPVTPDCDYTGVPSSMKNHVLNVHGLALGQIAYRKGVVLEGGKVAFVCSEHDDSEGGPFGFAKPQALIQHRMQGHGDEAPVGYGEYHVSAGQPPSRVG